MRVVNFWFATSTRLSYAPTVDTMIVGVSGTVASLVSTNPSLTLENTATIPAEKVDDEFQLYSAYAGTTWFPPFEFPLPAGQKIYVVITAATTGLVSVVFDDGIQLTLP